MVDADAANLVDCVIGAVGYAPNDEVLDLYHRLSAANPKPFVDIDATMGTLTFGRVFSNAHIRRLDSWGYRLRAALLPGDMERLTGAIVGDRMLAEALYTSSSHGCPLTLLGVEATEEPNASGELVLSVQPRLFSPARAKCRTFDRYAHEWETRNARNGYFAEIVSPLGYLAREFIPLTPVSSPQRP